MCFNRHAPEWMTETSDAPATRSRRYAGALRRLCYLDEIGAAAIEFAFVVPILVMLFAGIVQFGAAFFLQGNMANVAREVTRALAVGTIETEQEAENLAQSKLVDWDVTFDVSVTFPDPNDPDDTDFTVAISAPLSEAVIIDILGLFEEGSVSASASMREET